MIAINEDLLQRLLQNPVPDAAVVYYDRWHDHKGDILLMGAHQTSLRVLIQKKVALTEVDWLVIMYGILARLAKAHEYDLVHGDLKPTNGIILSHT